MFAGESRDSFAKGVYDLDLEHIAINIKEDLCSSDTYGFLLTLILSAALRVLIDISLQVLMLQGRYGLDVAQVGMAWKGYLQWK